MLKSGHPLRNFAVATLLPVAGNKIALWIVALRDLMTPAPQVMHRRMKPHINFELCMVVSPAYKAKIISTITNYYPTVL